MSVIRTIILTSFALLIVASVQAEEVKKVFLIKDMDLYIAFALH